MEANIRKLSYVMVLTFSLIHLSMKMAKAFTFLLYLAGLSGSLNFDEASDHDDNAEGGQTPSLSPDTDTNRPTSATSGKNTPVSNPDHQSAS